MMRKNISHGTVHNVPSDIRTALAANPAAHATWETLSPLARNEWICWVTDVKKSETRTAHITRLIEQLLAGSRRPCCWMGCIHRTDKPISPSVQGILKKRAR